jgi:hypothetical protein
MSIIQLFENYKSGSMELKNEVQEHLSQFPYLRYDIREEGKVVVIKFNDDVSSNFAFGLLDPFEKELTSKEPTTIKITKKKNLDKYEEFQDKVIIENIEKVDFPDLGITDLEVKIDTGATTSSIHCTNIEIDRKNKKVYFTALDDSYDEYTGQKMTLPLYSEIKVQSSNGDEESRPLVKMDIVIKDKTMESYFSLADRKELEFPVLVGKDVLSGKFLVNPGI